MGEREVVNIQAHSEQPKPRKRVPSIHTSLRDIRLLASVCDMRPLTQGNVLREETGREKIVREPGCVAASLSLTQEPFGTQGFTRLGQVTRTSPVCRTIVLEKGFVGHMRDVG